jgi:hypothetical protein
VSAIKVAVTDGMPHGGTAFLDWLIGGSEDVVSLGELNTRTLESDGACTCGAPSISTCPFWTAVAVRLKQFGRSLTGVCRSTPNRDEAFALDTYALYHAAIAASEAEMVLESTKSLERLRLIVYRIRFPPRFMRDAGTKPGILRLRVLRASKHRAGYQQMIADAARPARRSRRAACREASHLQ